MSEFAHYSLARWPIVVVTFTKVEVTNAEFEKHLKNLEKLFSQSRPFRIVFDLSESASIPLRFLSPQVQMLKRNQAGIERVLECSAIVISNPFIRCLLEALSKVYKFTKPNRVFNNTMDAIEWIANFS